MPLPSHACHRDDRDTSNAALGGPDALVKPDTQRTIGLVAEPNPGQFDHDCAGLRIASLADALVATHGTALEVAGRQPNIAPEPLAIVELPVEDFTNQHRGDSRSDALDLDEILNLLTLRSGLLAEIIALRSASIVLIIVSTNSRRCNSRTISALRYGGSLRPSPVRNCSRRSIRFDRRGS